MEKVFQVRNGCRGINKISVVLCGIPLCLSFGVDAIFSVAILVCLL